MRKTPICQGLKLNGKLFTTPAEAREYIKESGFHSYIDGREAAWLFQDDPRERWYQAKVMLVAVALSVLSVAVHLPYITLMIGGSYLLVWTGDTLWQKLLLIGYPVPQKEV